MIKTYKYRLYPSSSQKRTMDRYLDVCRGTYNKILGWRQAKYEETGKNVSEFDANKQVCEWRKEEFPWMQDCGIAMLHDVSRRVHKAYKGFFDRIKRGEKPGFPRFKGKGRYDSFTNPRFACKTRGKKIKLTNELGWVKFKQHRPIVGETKGYTVRKDATGNWWISIHAEVEEKPVSRVWHDLRAIGFDLGCTNVVTLSNGEKVENPKFLKASQKKLAKAQRQKKWCAARYLHRKVRNQRTDFNHKLSRNLVEGFDIISCESINIKQLKEETFKGIRKSMSDAAWAQLVQFVSYKAEEAGKIFTQVDPAYTSKTCSACGKIHKDFTFEKKTMRCSCGHVEDRDINAAKNILTLGLQGLGESPGSPRLQSGE